MAKSKVAPLNQLTIPKLELQAAVMGSRLVQAYYKLAHFENRQKGIMDGFSNYRQMGTIRGTKISTFCQQSNIRDPRLDCSRRMEMGPN